MTAVKNCLLPATLVVDYPCDRICRVDVDLEGVHIRYTLGQMLGQAGRAHDRAHEAEARVYRIPGVVVRPLAVADA